MSFEFKFVSMTYLDSKQGSQLKRKFQIPCVFPVHPQIFPVQILVICNHFMIYTKLTKQGETRPDFGLTTKLTKQI